MRTLAVLVFAVVLISVAGATCTPNGNSPSVTIRQPTANATVDSPVAVSAASTDTDHPVTLMQVYVDGSKKYQVSSNLLDAAIDMGSGQHRLTVQAQDSA